MMNHTPIIYAFLKPEKSFNPSANPSFSLIFRRKVAERFGFQTLQTLQPTLQVNRGKAEAGPGMTTRRVVTPKPGLVFHESGGFEKSVGAEGYLHG